LDFFDSLNGSPLGGLPFFFTGCAPITSPGTPKARTELPCGLAFSTGASGGLAQSLLAAGVIDGLPLPLPHQSGQGDGDVGKHENGEGKDVQDLLVIGDLDLLPLAQDGEQAVQEQAQIEAANSGH